MGIIVLAPLLLVTERSLVGAARTITSASEIFFSLGSTFYFYFYFYIPNFGQNGGKSGEMFW